MAKSKELCKELQELEKKKQDLVKRKQKEMVNEGKAFNCKKCEKTVIKNDASEIQLKLTICHDCLMILRKKEHKEAILSKIKFGKIVDIELDSYGWYENIKRITVYKQGMMYELRTVHDDDESYVVIDKEWKKEEPLEEYIEDEVKPWMKPRKEKPLFIEESK